MICTPDKRIYCDDLTWNVESESESILSLEPSVLNLIQNYIFMLMLVHTQISIAWSILWLIVVLDKYEALLPEGREQNVTVQSGYEADNESDSLSEADRESNKLSDDEAG